MRRNLGPDPDALKSVDDDLVVGLQTLTNNPQTIIKRTKNDGTRFDSIIGFDDKDDLARLVRRDGGVGQ